MSSNGKIRVLHLIKSFGRGGAEMLLAEGYRFANHARFEYHYGYYLPWKDAVVPSLRAQGAPVTCFGHRNNLRILLSARELARHLERERIDLVHAHMPVAGAVARVAGRMTGVPVVYSEHNLQERFHPATRWLNRSTWRWQARAIAVSGDVADSIRGAMGDRVPVDVVLNGVDVDRFRRDAADPDPVRRSHGIPANAPVIGTVAVFRFQKRLVDWLEAAARIRERVPDVHFLLVGDGPLRTEVEEAVDRLGLRGAVHMPGLLEDVLPYVAMMDVYMMSSIFEGLPVALLEAMSMECVPVCTAVGGIPELIRDGVDGYLVEPKQPQLLADAAATVLERPDRGRPIATAARRTVADGFSMARMAADLESIYLETLRGPARAGTSAQGSPRNRVESTR